MTAVPDILLEITARRRRRLGLAEAPAVNQASPLQDASHNAFCAALERRRGAAIIAEVKMGSPQLGSLEGRFDPEEQAQIYADNGAVALSVEVESDFFFGSYDLLERCRRASGLPTIAKDFMVTPRQLEWARDAGADAILLIASLFEAEALEGYAQAARRLGLVPLIETHDRSDLEKLEEKEWELVGVNNRDLRTFEVNLERAIELVPRLPAGALRVSESGIHHRQDVHKLGEAGFDAFLVGETLLQSANPAAKLRELLGAAEEGQG